MFVDMVYTFCKRYGPVFVLLYVYVRIGMLLLNYNQVWVQPEEFNWREYILMDGGASLSAHDLTKGLNWEVFEYEPRCTRPLSAYLEILDTKFRVLLWKFMPPHPSLSLTWIVLLVCSPILLFKLLKIQGVETSLALLATALYLANPGTLSLLVVDFRPAKALANFSILGCLYWASQLQAEQQQPSPQIRRSFVRFGLFCAFMYGSFFFDETALLSYPAVLFFFPGIIFKDIKRVICFLSLPVMVYAAYFYAFPALTTLAGFAMPQLTTYRPFVYSFGSLRQIVEFLALPDLLINTKNFLSDSFGLVNPWLSDSFYYRVLFLLNSACIGVVLARLSVVVFQKGWHALLQNVSWRTLVKGNVNVTRSLVFLVGITLFANILLHVVENRIWGLHWLNTYWPIFWVLFLTMLLQRLRLRILFVGIAVCIVASTSLYNFIYVNTAFKNFFYYRSVEFADVLVHKVNRFALPLKRDNELWQKTRLIWRDHEQALLIPHLPTELYYLVHDLRLIQAGAKYTRRFSVFNGHVTHFLLIKPNGNSAEKFIVVPEISSQ